MSDERTLALQDWLWMAAQTGQMEWGKCQVPSLEGFDVLHQLLSLVCNTHALQQHLQRVLGPPYPAQAISVSSTFERLPVLERHALLRQLAWLIEDWPQRFDAMCFQTRTFKFDLMANLFEAPQWYKEVAEGLNQTTRPRGPRKPIVLDPPLTVEQVEGYIEQTRSRTERGRWEILLGLLKSPVPLSTYGLAEVVGCSHHKVFDVVNWYNERSKS